MPRDRRSLPPLDAAALERMALRYVERFATTRARLAAYLQRKVRERGWDGAPADLATIAERFAERGYIDDRGYAEAKATSLTRRGYGRRRVDDALRHAGIAAEDAAVVRPAIAARAGEAALAFARRRRIGPFATVAADAPLRQKQIAQMARAGHSFALARQIVEAQPGDVIEVDDAAESIPHCNNDAP